MDAESCHTKGISNWIAVTNPFTGAQIGTIPDVPAEEVPRLVEDAKRGACRSRRVPRHIRASILNRCASSVEDASEEFADLISAETGKTRIQATKEVARCVNTLKLCADEARRNIGEVLPFDAYSGSENRQGWFTREPLGIILAITPFNAPLNLVAHKLGPAIAGGNAVVFKPSELAPLSGLRLVKCFKDVGLENDIITVATGGVALSEALVRRKEIRMISFTGGFETGEKIARAAGLKRLVMELGGNAAVIVMPDCDLSRAVEYCISGAFSGAGQNCISAQRLLVHEDIYGRFKEALVARTQDLKAGDPSLPETDIGPMITEEAAIRAEAAVRDAVTAGATLLCGNVRKGGVYTPTVLENIDTGSDIWTREIFAPVVLLHRIKSLDEAVELANQPDFSLQAGIFTSDLETALGAAAALDASGVMINDSSDYRFDAMPFGGFKYGSMGREGVRFAFEEMTQPKVVCIRRNRRL
ncbi:aldehyde dehydrogenase [Caballeronia sordidicola]|uniref:Aldehyde dehydrogenase n=1 Tax=Caballeronia sordidicola TaxID=196367 RepID=A0A158HPE8_CABSO|nr:aldehyde dehydrogenase family protein [Caballeronia sordidicola]SAL46284.1 aldehyde dehydrogenase [Caballeronia sordidicola]